MFYNSATICKILKLTLEVKNKRSKCFLFTIIQVTLISINFIG